MTVYFIQTESGLVKIGHSRDPEGRLAAYQGFHYENLRLIRLADGQREAEVWFHKKFSHLRIRGEWFHFDPLMMTVAPPADLQLCDIGSKSDEFRKTRKFLGLSQEQLGKVLGRGRRQIIRYEKGNSDIPPWAELALESLVHRQEEAS